MYRIILCCQNGASTDLLAVKMEEASKTLDIDCSVNAYPYTKLEYLIDEADLVLLAPQIRFKRKSLEEQLAHKGVPFMNVETTDYGLLRGEKVLRDCIAAIEANK